MHGEAIIYQHNPATWLRFASPVQVLSTHNLAKVAPLLQHVEQMVERHGLFAAGFITYEAAPAFDPALQVRPPGSLPLVWFGLYRQAAPINLPPVTDGAHSLSEWQLAIDYPAYAKNIAVIKTHIARGDTYQVNYTTRLRAQFSGDPLSLFGQLVQSQRRHYGAFIDTGPAAICSASPELFFSRNGPELESKPMKGTAARGKTLPEDRQQIDALRHSAKNRAENVMIVDMIRNDLGRIAAPGSVRVPRLFDIERYPTVLQMTSTVTARSNAPTADIIAALFPCASITGAPKARTMQLIAQLETGPRGIYTGCIGLMAPGRRAQFNVAIRTVHIDKSAGTAEYGTGGGIVWDSVSAQEYEECRLKARVLTARQPEFCLLETLLWQPDTGYFLLDEHVRRLAGSAEYFDIAVDWPLLLDKLIAAEAGLSRPHRLRLLVDPAGEISLQASPLNPTPPPQPWRVALADHPINPTDPFLYHKTTRRHVYNAARAAQPGFDDVLLWNERGELTEATIANVVVRRGGQLLTPPVECGLLAGTFRDRLLAEGKIRERVIPVDALTPGEEIFLINSVRRWVPAVLV